MLYHFYMLLRLITLKQGVPATVLAVLLMCASPAATQEVTPTSPLEAGADALGICLVIPALEGVYLGDMDASTLQQVPQVTPFLLGFLLEASAHASTTRPSPVGTWVALLVQGPSEAAASPPAAGALLGDQLGLLVGGPTVLYLLEPLTRQMDRIADNASNPQWSWDGERLAYRAGSTFVVYTLADGSRQTYDLPEGSIGASWSPNGAYVATQTGIRSDDASGALSFPQSITIVSLEDGVNTTLVNPNLTMMRLYPTQYIRWTVGCDLILEETADGAAAQPAAPSSYGRTRCATGPT